MGKINDSPCRFCGERRIGCHGQCKQYMEYANKRREESEKQFEKNRMINDIEHQNHCRRSRRSSKSVLDGQRN